MKTDNSYKTAITRKSPSIPARYVINKLLPQLRFKSILDWGCGKGKDLELFQQAGLKTAGYDPYFMPHRPRAKFDFGICTYVLNAIQDSFERRRSIANMGSHIKRGGNILVTVRGPSEIYNSASENDWKYHLDGFITSSGTFQCPISATELYWMLNQIGYNSEIIKNTYKMVMVLGEKL